jgi:hypothetical protein
MAIPAAQSLALSSVQGPQVGAAAGAFSMLRQLGGAAGVAAMVAGFAGFGSYTNRSSFTDGFVAALVIGAALAAVAGIVGARVPTRRGRGRSGRAPVPARAEGEPGPTDQSGARTVST